MSMSRSTCTRRLSDGRPIRAFSSAAYGTTSPVAAGRLQYAAQAPISLRRLLSR